MSQSQIEQLYKILNVFIFDSVLDVIPVKLMDIDSIIEEYADTIGAFEIWAAKCGGDGVRLVGYDLAEIIDAKYARKVKQIKEGKKHD